jgi:hypothetical protein
MTNGTATIDRDANQPGPAAEIDRMADRLAATGLLTAADVHQLAVDIPRRHRSRLLAALLAAKTVGLVAGARSEAKASGSSDSVYLAELGVRTG